ncbi:MAG TPA: TadE/TadG family type IV pilus assembly protein [Stellaceae bacterium]|nr:TadE/TadG family type IV pilus assembly protein [Stellaceae bacterium]
MSKILATARILLRSLTRKDGAVLVWFAVTAIPLLLAVGVGIDVARAYAVKVRLGAAIDDAGLAVATTLDPNINAQNRLTKYFYGNFASTQIGTPTAVSMVNDATVANAIDVTGTATVPTTFMALAGFNSITVQATAQIVRRAPNIDFYLMLDSSPSMAIAATQTDINTMVSHTSAQGGCGFGCHHSQTTASSCGANDVLGNPIDPATGNPMDNYALARSLGVTLRIDLLRQAAQNLTTTATSTAAQNDAKYRMAVYTFDVNFNTIQTLTNSLSTVSTSAGNIQQLEMYCNNHLSSATDSNKDADTNFDSAFTSINGIMPAPGNGSNIAGDTPQEVLFLVTDGVEDELSTYSTKTPTSSSYGNVSSGRQESVINVADCTTIKNRGIRIAVLYTEYLPLPTNNWYVNHVQPFQPNIGSTLQSCASPGLYFMVQTGGDISGALSTLFEQAVQSAYLAQ